jgi:hypothetical protein
MWTTSPSGSVSPRRPYPVGEAPVGRSNGPDRADLEILGSRVDRAHLTETVCKLSVEYDRSAGSGLDLADDPVAVLEPERVGLRAAAGERLEPEQCGYDAACAESGAEGSSARLRRDARRLGSGSRVANRDHSERRVEPGSVDAALRAGPSSRPPPRRARGTVPRRGRVGRMVSHRTARSEAPVPGPQHPQGRRPRRQRRVASRRAGPARESRSDRPLARRTPNSRERSPEERHHPADAGRDQADRSPQAEQRAAACGPSVVSRTPSILRTSESGTPASSRRTTSRAAPLRASRDPVPCTTKLMVPAALLAGLVGYCACGNRTLTRLGFEPAARTSPTMPITRRQTVSTLLESRMRAPRALPSGQ